MNVLWSIVAPPWILGRFVLQHAMNFSGMSQRANQPRNVRVGTNPSNQSMYGRPATITQTPGMMANTNVNSIFQLQAFKHGYEKELREGQFVFIHRGTDDGAHSDTSFGKSVVMNIPMANYKLFKLHTVDDTKTNAISILGTFAPMGVVKTNGTSVPWDVRGAPSLHLNVCTRGQCKTFNMWSGAKDGDLLYLRLARSAEALQGSDFSMKVSGMAETDASSKSNVWQFTPQVHHTRAAASHSEDVWDVYIGRVYLSRRCVQSTAPVERTRQLHRMVSGDQIDIFVDP